VLKQSTRGKDGTGLGFLINSQCRVLKKSVEPENFNKLISEKIGKLNATIAIGHNRSATCNYKEKHMDKESHPFISENREFMLIHNGIFKEHSFLRKFLALANEHKFSSGVDSEIYVHILEELLLKSKDRFEALKRFYSLSSGNIIILFSDGEMIGVPESSFYLLTVGKKVYIASEMGTFKNIIAGSKEDTNLYSPSRNGCMVSIKLKNNFPVIKLVGEWKTGIMREKGWIATNEVTCDFCKSVKLVMRFKDKKLDKTLDKCLKCFREKAIYKETPSTSTYSPNLPYQRYYDNQKRMREVSARCELCSDWITLDKIMVCRSCNQLMCVTCYLHDDHTCDIHKNFRGRATGRSIFLPHRLGED